MILADEHIPAKIIAAIRAIPLDIISVREVYKSEPDNKLIELAQVQMLIIITEDKDFGEWIFAHHLPTVGVIFLRYHYKLTDTIILNLVNYLKINSEKLKGKFVTISVDKIRVREI